MFKADRVGTPVMMQGTQTLVTSAATLQELPTSNSVSRGNVVNASPVADFGVSNLFWTNAAPMVLQNNFRGGFYQQLTITEPLAGDTVGLELNGSLRLYANQPTIILPCFFKASAAAAATLAVIESTGPTTTMGQLPTRNTLINDEFQDCTYKEQLILNKDSVAGTYCHGFQIINVSGANANITILEANISVRQFNDLQQLSYRDPLR